MYVDSANFIHADISLYPFVPVLNVYICRKRDPITRDHTAASAHRGQILTRTLYIQIYIHTYSYILNVCTLTTCSSRLKQSSILNAADSFLSARPQRAWRIKLGLMNGDVRSRYCKVWTHSRRSDWSSATARLRLPHFPVPVNAPPSADTPTGRSQDFRNTGVMSQHPPTNSIRTFGELQCTSLHFSAIWQNQWRIRKIYQCQQIDEN